MRACLVEVEIGFQQADATFRHRASNHSSFAKQPTASRSMRSFRVPTQAALRNEIVAGAACSRPELTTRRIANGRRSLRR